MKGNVVPVSLQRLRAADIIRMAGLAAASQGQEYCRAGGVHSTQRQEARIYGVVEVPRDPGSSQHVTGEQAQEKPLRFPVSVDVQSNTSWETRCVCRPDETNGAGQKPLCAHAAALIYRWLDRPASFSIVDASALSAHQENGSSSPESSIYPDEATNRSKSATREKNGSSASLSPSSATVQRTIATTVSRGSLLEMLTQLTLSDLRTVAREYGLATGGMSRQQLTDTIHETMMQADMVRQVATTLEKSERQLLAAIILAGALLTDEELRGLCERFSLGQARQLPSMLGNLQNKALLFRTSTSLTGTGANQRSTMQPVSSITPIIDVGWFVAHEVQIALHVSVPVTPVDIKELDEHGNRLQIQLAEPFTILGQIMLIGRALQGFVVDRHERWLEQKTVLASPASADGLPVVRPGLAAGAASAIDGSVPLPMPGDMPPQAIISFLQKKLAYPPSLLHLLVRLLHQMNWLEQNAEANILAVPANLAFLLLGDEIADRLRELFHLWLTQSSYGELADLQDEDLRLRCRATVSNQPVLRTGELEAENALARQAIIMLLAQTPGNRWLSFASFARFVYRLQPHFLQHRQRQFVAPHWWIEHEAGRPLRPEQLHDWSQAEYHYLSRLISGPLHWWGICDVAYDTEGKLLAFRLTDLATRLLQEQEQQDQTVNSPSLKEIDYSQLAQAVVIESETAFSISCEMQFWPLITFCETFFEPGGVQQQKLFYHLSARALGQAIGRGEQPETVLTFLRTLTNRLKDDCTETGLDKAGRAEKMVYQIEQWISSYGRVRLYTGVTLIETAEAGQMQEIIDNPRLTPHIVQTVHPTLLILTPQGSDLLIDEYKRQGQSALVHEGLDRDIYGPE